MNPVSNNQAIRFGRIHVFSKQVNAAFTNAYTQNTIPSELPVEAQQRMQQGDRSFYTLMGDDRSKKIFYSRLNDGRGIVLTNKDTRDLSEFKALRQSEREQPTKRNRRGLCERFLMEKSRIQTIHWVYGPNDPAQP